MFPFLGRVLGSENFGKIMFAQAFVAYFILFVDFGFNVTATKEIADSHDNLFRVSEIFWNTLLAKGFLLGLSFIVFASVVFLFPRFREDYILYCICFINVISNFLFPLWLFQGLEKMGLITIINTLPRILMIFAVFYFVKDRTFYVEALLIQMLAPLISAIASLYLAFKLKYVVLMKPDVHKAKQKFAGSWQIFVTSISSNLYTTTNTVILGLLTNNSAVGIYTGADKIVRALISLISSVTQVIFPRINIYFRESKEKCLRFIKQIILLAILICSVLGIILFFGAETIIQQMFRGGDFTRSVNVLKLSSLLPLVSIVNGLLAINLFVVFGYKKELLKIVLSGTAFSLIIIWPLVCVFRELGPPICATLTELFILIMLITRIKRLRLWMTKT